jgi:hypothetical protein
LNKKTVFTVIQKPPKRTALQMENSNINALLVAVNLEQQIV